MPGSGRSPGGGKGYTLFLPREFHGQRSLASYSPWGNLKLTKKQEILTVRVLGCQQYLANLKRKKGFPDSSVGKESDCNAGDSGTIPGSGRSPGEGIGYPLQYSWASLVAQRVKELPPMQETWVRSLGQEDPLEKGKATHSSILAWRIPWTVESMGWQRVRHN